MNSSIRQLGLWLLIFTLKKEKNLPHPSESDLQTNETSGLQGSSGSFFSSLPAYNVESSLVRWAVQLRGDDLI